MASYPHSRNDTRPGPSPAVGAPLSMHDTGPLLPDSRKITARAIRAVWETMQGSDPPPPRYLSDRLPPNLIRFAAAKGSLGAVMHALSRWGLSDALEPRERERARLTLARTAMAASAMRKELGLILARCADGGIETVLFKGHDLIGTCYYDATIRPVTDADLLVRQHDYRRLAGVLSDAGYLPCGGGHSTTWFRGSLIIDVHFGFVGDSRNPANAYLPRFESEEIMEGSRLLEIDGVPYRSPDPRHSLIMTALHALTHSYVMDFWFMDAGALLIHNDRPSFTDSLTDVARSHRLSDILNYHLWSIGEIFGYPGGLPLPAGYRPPLAVRRLIQAAVKRTDYLFFGDVLLGFTIDSYRKKFYYFKEMALPHRDIIAREMDIDPHNIPGVYRARLLHLVKSGFRVLFPGRR